MSTVKDMNERTVQIRKSRQEEGSDDERDKFNPSSKGSDDDDDDDDDDDNDDDDESNRVVCARTLIFDRFMEAKNELDNLEQNDDDNLLKEAVDVISPLACPNNNSSLSLVGKRSSIDDSQTSIKIPKLTDNISSHLLPS